MSAAVVLLLYSAALCVGTFQHTDRTLRMARAWKQAIRGLTNKEIAGYQGIDEGQCHNQIEGNGTNPGLYRSGKLPDSVLVAFTKALGEELGLLVLDSQDARDLLLEDAIRTRRMLKASLPPAREKEHVS